MKRTILIGLGLAALLGSSAWAGDNEGGRIWCNGQWTTTGNSPIDCYKGYYGDHRIDGRRVDRRRDSRFDERNYDRRYDNRRRDDRYYDDRYYREHDDRGGERILRDVLRELIR